MKSFDVILRADNVKLIKRRDDGIAFTVTVNSIPLKVIASDGDGWDHVSVSPVTPLYRCPKWSEMQAISDLCFEPEETVMQLHPPVAQRVNIHPYVLHLWRPQTRHVGVIPMPPSYMV
jgi:hypothetical protein